MIWQYIVAKQFFPTYAPKVRNWKNKMAGKSGRGKPLTFTDADKKHIKAGIKKLANDMGKMEISKP